jgi:hypothetical protein
MMHLEPRKEHLCRPAVGILLMIVASLVVPLVYGIREDALKDNMNRTLTLYLKTECSEIAELYTALRHQQVGSGRLAAYVKSPWHAPPWP